MESDKQFAEWVANGRLLPNPPPATQSWVGSSRGVEFYLQSLVGDK